MWKFLSDLIEWFLDLLGLQKKGSSSSSQSSSGSVPVAPIFPAEVTARPETELRLEADIQPQYQKNKSILTYRESVFYKSLIEAIDNNQFQVFAKVRLADFTFLANQPKEQKFHRNQLMCKHVDFLLCTKPSLAPILGIELDDSSHKLSEQQERDKFKDNLFLAVGLPLLRMDLQSDYPSDYVRQKIEEKMKDSPINGYESSNSKGSS